AVCATPLTVVPTAPKPAPAMLIPLNMRFNSSDSPPARTASKASFNPLLRKLGMLMLFDALRCLRPRVPMYRTSTEMLEPMLRVIEVRIAGAVSGVCHVLRATRRAGLLDDGTVPIADLVRDLISAAKRRLAGAKPWNLPRETDRGTEVVPIVRVPRDVRMRGV